MMADPLEQSPTMPAMEAAASRRSGWYAHYVLLILCLANALGVVDRQIMSLLLEPVKQDLQASDTAMSLLTGASFVVFYSLFGIPIALWTDRGNRKNILGLGIAVYSALTAACGAASSFAMMAVMRAGVGIGEAAGTPASMSLLTDYYAREHRSRALSIFYFPIGFVLFTPLIGLIADQYGWRAAFFATGVPGVLIALLVWLTVKEPQRGAKDDRRRPVELGTFRLALAAMWKSKPFMLILLGTAITGLGSGTLVGWGNALMMRAFNVSAGQVATVALPFLGLGVMLGTLGGGFLTSAVVKWRKSERWMILLPALVSMVTVVAGFMFVYAQSFGWVVFAGMIGAGSAAFRMAPYQAVSLELVPANVRGLASALTVIATSVVGMAGGPLVVGLISDYLTPTLGSVQALRTGFLFAPFTLAFGLIPFFMALKYFDDDGLIEK